MWTEVRESNPDPVKVSVAGGEESVTAKEGDADTMEGGASMTQVGRGPPGYESDPGSQVAVGVGLEGVYPWSQVRRQVRPEHDHSPFVAPEGG